MARSLLSQGLSLRVDRRQEIFTTSEALRPHSSKSIAAASSLAARIVEARCIASSGAPAPVHRHKIFASWPVTSSGEGLRGFCNQVNGGKGSGRGSSGVLRASLAAAEVVGEKVPELVASVVLEDDLKSLMIDEAFEESVSHDAQTLLTESWGLISERLGEEEDGEESTSGSEGSSSSSGIDLQRVELSVLLCSDKYIKSLNATWRGVTKATDVLSFPQDQPQGLSPILLLGDIIISMETAERQAAERGHTLRDELRILMVHGVLHLLGMDHEESEEAEREMQFQERKLLSQLGWHVEGLIDFSVRDNRGKVKQGSTKQGWKPPFKMLLCDMDGTLLNSSSKISPCTAEALREASARGVQVAIATGKARPAAMAALATAGLAGDGGVVSQSSPGVFIQGLRVYGDGGSVVHNSLLPTHVVAQAFEFSLKHNVALIGFSGDHCVTMRDLPLVEQLHTKYYEPRARVYSSIDEILNDSPIQKLLFYDTEQGITDFIRPYWSKHLSIDEAALTQAVPDMLEILPPGQSKGAGVKILLESMGIHPDEVMALGDGENDKEMLEIVGWGVAMSNGSPITKAVAKAVVGSNDDGGIAEAINKFILS